MTPAPSKENNFGADTGKVSPLCPLLPDSQPVTGEFFPLEETSNFCSYAQNPGVRAEGGPGTFLELVFSVARRM